MRRQIWQRVTGSWVTVKGKRREGGLLICINDAGPSGVIMPQACAARTPRGIRVRAEGVVLVILIEVIPGYTEGMKTAISLPDDTYEQATRQAQALGISRSEFFARAARSYLDQLASRSLTQQIDEALRTGDDDSNAAAAAAGRSYLAGQDDW